MPRTPIDYSNTIIYKIVCNDDSITDLYVGSTTDFKRRKSSHKNSCNNINNNAHNYKLYKLIRENGGWYNWTMLEVEKFNCIDGNEARAKERDVYNQLKPSMNSIKPQITDIEYIEQITEYNKQYYKLNKDKIYKQTTKYYELNKDKVYKQKKQYNELNKDNKKDYDKQRYQLSKIKKALNEINI
jgi:hypothetical protein